MRVHRNIAADGSVLYMHYRLLRLERLLYVEILRIPIFYMLGSMSSAQPVFV